MAPEKKSIQNATAEAFSPEPQLIQSPPGRDKFRFVNTYSKAMNQPRIRMKAAFKAHGVSSNSQTSQMNKNSLLLEQSFDSLSSNFPTTPADMTSTYVFQMSIKRPPGRPKKNPEALPKVKKPQGRPRKYPVEISGSSVSGGNKTKKKPLAITSSTQASSSDAVDKISKVTNLDIDFPVDTRLLESSESLSTQDSAQKRGRGRPKKNDQPLPREDHDVAASVAAAAVAAHLLSDDNGVTGDDK